ncbi:MAG: hypothetical protein J7M03_07410 [Candidatus Desulfofervidaceae bacterium]|nr:hypothetical protein [Candidatus Desulfofervidaceae bacterium]
MGRRKGKTVLNQDRVKVNMPKEVKEAVEKTHNIDAEEEIKKELESEFDEAQKNLDKEFEETSPETDLIASETPESESEVVTPEAPIESPEAPEMASEEKIEEDIPKRTVESLSKSEYRQYLRTGRMHC